MGRLKHFQASIKREIAEVAATMFSMLRVR